MTPPVRVCCFQRHSSVQCPDGMTMCCLCFSRFPVEELNPVEGGVEDVCLSCAREEKDHGQRPEEPHSGSGGK